MTELADNAVLEGTEIPDTEDAADSGASNFDSTSQADNIKAAVSELQRSREAAKEEPPRPYYSDATGKALVPEIPGDEPLSPRKAAEKTIAWREQKAGKSIGYEEYIQQMLDANIAAQQPTTVPNDTVAPDGQQPPPDSQQPPPVANELPRPDAPIEERQAVLEAQRRQLSDQWQANISQYDQVIPPLHARTNADEAAWEKAAASLNIKTAADYQHLRVTNPDAFEILERARGDIHRDRVIVDALVAERANTIQFAHEQDAKLATEQHIQWTNEQDDLFVKSHPEFADPKQARELQDGVLRFVKDTTGLSDAEIASEWNRPGSPWRHHAGQAMLATAAKNAARLQSASSAKPLPKNLPPVQRPGMRPETPTSVYSEVSRYDRQLSNARTTSHQLRAAAGLLGAARRAQSR
jgi:hypothetical protein